MKRVFAYLLVVIMLLSMAACGVEQPITGDVTPDDGQQTNSTSAPEEETTEAQMQEFQEVTVVDNEYCTIKITEIKEDGFWGYTLKAFLENKTADKTIMFSVEEASINNVCIDPMFACEVAAGKKANEEISFSDSALEEVDIGKFSDVWMTFRAYDSNDWSADSFAEAETHIYPYGEENAVSFEREAQPEDNVIVDTDDVTVTVTGYEKDDLWGYTAKLYIVNKTDATVMVSVDEVSVNGYMVDPFFATSVSAGKCAFDSISWSDSAFEENGIIEVEEIEFVIRVYDNDNWLADDFVKQTITLEP